MLQQSQVWSALVGQLVAQQDGGLGDLSASSTTSYVGSKGAARREKLQSALAEWGLLLGYSSGGFEEAAPIFPMPEECSEQVSMCRYLERFGGYAGQRETGYIMWCLAHVMDCLTAEDYAGAREHVALTTGCHRSICVGWGKVGFCMAPHLARGAPPWQGRGGKSSHQGVLFCSWWGGQLAPSST